LAIKDELLIHGTAGINFETIMSCERNQSQRTLPCMIHLYEMPRTGKSMKQKVGLLSGTGGRENGGGVLTVNGYGVSLASDENVL
jgi:hypothetical protein